MHEQILEADLTFTGERFEPGVQVSIGKDGRIAAVGRLGSKPTRRLEGRALLPGMVNVHSHAFQIGLRGRGENYPEGTGDFWSWREAMYRLAGDLDPGRFQELCLRAFREMRRGGITAVGEFHYLHHSGKGADFELDDRLLAAASEAGIRLVLLEAYYSIGGIGKPLAGAQSRFATKSPEAYWSQIDRLAGRLDPGLQSLGAAAHSIRAAGLDEIIDLHTESRRRGMIFHMHVEEQEAEIRDCVLSYGGTPMKLLNQRLEIDSAFTAIHCTHTAGEEMERFLALGGNVCICPLTEAALADGIADAPRIHHAGARISIGTDCNARISMLEEARWLEYVQRLDRRRRGILRDRSGNLALPLFQAATLNGARALGLAAGRIAPGLWADLTAIDLTSPLLAGAVPDTLLEAILFGVSEEVVAATCVGGKWEERP
ncbi:MAG: formimidoylglutamate deiminase [Acidobacteria bacterium]|nr:formimidoylglutamate deiminase [Acidobacteriota bacterium]